MNTKFEKIYVGKGKANQFSTKITVDLDMLKELAYEFEGKNLVTIEIAEMKQPDNFGRTHTAFVTKRTETSEETSEETPEENQVQEDKPKRKSRKKQ
jgi:hypothetical protein